MEILKNRKTPLQSKRKVVVMMNLFERYVDEKIVSIEVETGLIKGENYEYRVDIRNNKVSKVYPDPDW